MNDDNDFITDLCRKKMKRFVHRLSVHGFEIETFHYNKVKSFSGSFVHIAITHISRSRLE